MDIDIRRLLQIVLGVLISAIVLLSGLLIYRLTWEPSTVVVREVSGAEKQAPEEKKHRWEDKGERAIELVSGDTVGPLDDELRDHLDTGDSPTIGGLVEHEWFRTHRLHAGGLDPLGWRAKWWGETKYGASYYRVQYGFRDGRVVVGPTWLVDLERQKVVPKNVLARVATNPAEGMDSEYYDKSEEVVSALTRHTFDSGLTLAGALLLYFDRRTSDESDDSLLGWTVQHDRNALFTTYFQWKEQGETIYAEFEFDYDRKALKAVNLHAANIMRKGEQFEEQSPVDILPTHYEPDARSGLRRWTGPARRAYRDPDNRDPLRALDTVLSEDEMIGALEWLFRVRAKTPEEFERCKEERRCKWKPESLDDGGYKVTYIYDLGEGEQTIAWKVDLEEERLEPKDRISRLAYRVVHPRRMVRGGEAETKDQN